MVQVRIGTKPAAERHLLCLVVLPSHDQDAMCGTRTIMQLNAWNSRDAWILAQLLHVHITRPTAMTAEPACTHQTQTLPRRCMQQLMVPGTQQAQHMASCHWRQTMALNFIA
jgi:hypothetical protein